MSYAAKPGVANTEDCGLPLLGFYLRKSASSVVKKMNGEVWR
jgi:hypothetical protein